jgi:hypothetical protein
VSHLRRPHTSATPLCKPKMETARKEHEINHDTDRNDLSLDVNEPGHQANQPPHSNQGNVKQSHYRPEQANRFPGGWGFQSSKQSAHEGGKGCQPYAPAAFTPQEIFLVLISITGRVESRAIVQPDQWKIPMTLSGIEPATFRLVAQFLNLLRPRAPHLSPILDWKCTNMTQHISLLTQLRRSVSTAAVNSG